MNQRIIKWLLIVCGICIGGVVIIYTSVYLFKDTVFEKVKYSINDSLNGGELAINDFSFAPFSEGLGLTFTADDILLTDSLYKEHNQPVIKLGRLSVRINFWRLFLGQLSFKEVRLRDGQVVVFTDKSGYSNLSLFQNTKKSKDKDKDSDPFLRIKKLTLRNISVSFADSVQEKYYAFTFRDIYGRLGRASNGWKADMQGPMFFDHLVFNTDKGAFLKETEAKVLIDANWEEDQKRIVINSPTFLEIPTNERIAIKGTLDVKERHGPMDLFFSTERIFSKRATALLADYIAHKIDTIGINAYVAAEVSVKGRLGIPKPRVDVNFEADTFNFEIPVGFFKRVKAKGRFTNQVDTTKAVGPENSIAEAKGIEGFFEDVAMVGDLKIVNLQNPWAKVHFKAVADSTSFKNILDPDRYRVVSGGLEIELDFEGNLKNFYNPITDDLEGKVNGYAHIKELGLVYQPQSIQLSKINSVIEFDQDLVRIKQLDLRDQKNAIYIKGEIAHLFENLLGSTKPIKAKVDLNIPDWQFNWLDILTQENNKAKKNANYKFSNVIDDAIQDIHIEANLSAGKISYHNFTAENLKGKFRFGEYESVVDGLEMKAFGGVIQFDGNVHRPGGMNKRSYFKAKGKVSQTNLAHLLHSFNNFGQETVTSKNIKGILSAEFQLSSQLTSKQELDKKTMDGYLDFRLDNGNLINFKPLLAIKKVIFKKRPLEDVKFAPLKTKFVIKGEEIDIRKMQIESNVLTLFVEGVYSFGHKTDISVQVPWQNLKKRDEDYELQNYNSNEMRSIFLRAVEQNGEVSIKLDSRKMKTKRKERREGKDEKN